MDERGERQRALVARAWDALQAVLAAWAAYQLAAQLLNKRRR
jgi:hypothetical protein